MATVIEAICADDGNLSSMIIYQAEGFRVGWFDPTMPFPNDVLGRYSPNGWTDNERGLGYLKHHFGLKSRSGTKANCRYRMIIFDSHESQVSHAFLQYCIDHQIIACCLPPHSTTLLRPLDVCIFSLYKNYYAQLLEKEFRYGR